MSATFFDNFNFDPVSTTVHNGTYSVPGGSYAKVRVTKFTTDFKIDTIIAINSRYTISGSDGVDGVKYTNNTGYILHGTVQALLGNVGGSVTIGGNYVHNFLYDPTTPIPPVLYNETKFVTLYPKNSLVISGNAGSIGSIGWEFHAVGNLVPSEFWVPAGTDLDGDEYIVELYTKQGN